MTDQTPIRVILVDDDKDDCDLFKEALEQASFPTLLKSFYFGEDLLNELSRTIGELPDVKEQMTYALLTQPILNFPLASTFFKRTLKLKKKFSHLI